MATSLEESKIGPDGLTINKYLSLGAKIATIGPADPEIIRLRVIKKRT